MYTPAAIPWIGYGVLAVLLLSLILPKRRGPAASQSAVQI